MSNYQIPENLLLQSVADEIVILDPTNGNYFTLDAIGARMIELFREYSSLDVTENKIAQEYDAAPDVIHNDLVALLDEMAQHNLVQKTDT